MYLYPTYCFSPVRLVLADAHRKCIAGVMETNPPYYLQFIGWGHLWGAISHRVSALLNCERKTYCWQSKTLRFVLEPQRCNFLRYVVVFHAAPSVSSFLGLLAVRSSSNHQTVPCLVLQIRPRRRGRIDWNNLRSTVPDSLTALY